MDVGIAKKKIKKKRWGKYILIKTACSFALQKPPVKTTLKFNGDFKRMKRCWVRSD